MFRVEPRPISHSAGNPNMVDPTKAADNPTFPKPEMENENEQT